MPSAHYPHKNLEIIFDICDLIILRKKPCDFIFLTTVDRKSKFSEKCNLKKYKSLIKNIGPYNYSEALRLYSEASVVFIPSLLETFSTSYLEAIACRIPLVTADKNFSREICGDYAFYYPALSPINALKSIEEALLSNLSEKEPERNRILKLYGDQLSRANKAISILISALNNSSFSKNV